MDLEEVNISIGSEHFRDIDEIVLQCIEAGLRVSNVLKSIGIIIGNIDPAHIDILRGIDGVTAVERPRQIHLPPPDENIQ